MQNNISGEHRISTVLLTFINTEKSFVTCYLFSNLFSTFSKILITLSLGWYYQLVLHLEGPKYRFLYNHFYIFNNPESYFIFLFVVLILALIALYLKLLFSKIIIEKFSLFLRNSLVQKQLESDSALHHQKSFGKYLLRYSGDLSSVQNFVTKGCIDPIVHLLTILIIFGFLVSYSLPLTLIILGIHVLSISLLFPLNNKLQSLAQKRRDQRSVNLNWITLILLRFDTVKVTNKSKLEHKRFVKKSEKLYLLGIKFAKLQSLITTLPQVVFVISLVTILFFFWKSQQHTTHLNPSEILIFILLVYYAKNSLVKLLSVQSFWKVSKVSFLKITETLNRPLEKFDLNSAIQLKQKILLQDIQVAHYPFELFFREPIQIPHQQTTLISGRTQKTSTLIVKLLTGVYYPISGKIQSDEVQINAQNIARWRKLCAPISLDFPLSGQTVWQAISFYNRIDKFNEAQKLLLTYQINLFGKTPSEFLNTKLELLIPYFSTQDHVLLIWIRALLSNKPIFIIDDILGLLSQGAFDQITDVLNKLNGKKTILIISNSQNLTYDNIYIL